MKTTVVSVQARVNALEMLDKSEFLKRKLREK